MSLANIHPDCHNFVVVVEELLEKRQQSIKDGTQTADPRNDSWGPRIWKRTEMEDMVYSSYKQMRRGRITRPPKREKVVEIANYLNCTLTELNRLLVAAEIIPLDIYVTGQELETLLQPNITVAQSLAMPAMVINRDWQIHFLNTQMLALYNMSLDEVEQIPARQRNVLRLIFDPDLPLHPNLINKRRSWVRMARQTIYGFKVANELCQFEDWYQELVDEWMSLPEFEYHWHSVRTDAPFSFDESTYQMPKSLLLDTTIPSLNVYTSLRPLIISVGYFQFDFPQIMALAPDGEEARLKLAEAGALG